MNITDVLPKPWRPYAKAIIAVAGVIIGSLLLVLQPGETLAEVTQYEWIVILGTILGVGGGTYGARNDYPLPSEPAGEGEEGV